MTDKKPYKLRQHGNSRAIDCEFFFMPGKRISTKTYDMREAILWAEAKLKDAGFGNENSLTFKEFAKDFFSRRDPRSQYAKDRATNHIYDDTYYKKKESNLNKYLMPEFGNLLIGSITSLMIQDWFFTFTRPDGKALSGSTKNKILDSLDLIMADARLLGEIQENPVDKVQKMAETPTSQRRPLTREEEELLFPPKPAMRIDIWGSDMWACYFSISYDTGFRPGEIAALRVCDIYQTPNGLAVGSTREVCTHTMTIKERVKTTGKGMSRRVGLLYNDTAELLVKYIEDHGLKGEDLLFTCKRWVPNSYISASASNKHFKIICKRYGITGTVQYSLRHSYTTDRRGDLPDTILAVSMGHTKLRDDYDHQKATDLIRRLEDARGNLFKNRERRDQEEEIKPYSAG